MQSDLEASNTFFFVAFIISFFTIMLLATELDTLKSRGIKNDQSIRR